MKLSINNCLRQTTKMPDNNRALNNYCYLNLVSITVYLLNMKSLLMLFIVNMEKKLTNYLFYLDLDLKIQNKR